MRWLNTNRGCELLLKIVIEPKKKCPSHNIQIPLTSDISASLKNTEQVN